MYVPMFLILEHSRLCIILLRIPDFRNYTLPCLTTAGTTNLEDALQQNIGVSAQCDAVFGGSCYIVEAELLTWSEARARCVQLGGHLAIIESQAEDQFVANLTGSKR